MKNRIMAWFGKKNKIGTQGAVFTDVDMNTNFQKDYFVDISEARQNQFNEIRMKMSGLKESLDHIAFKMGCLRIEEDTLWEDIRKEYTIDKDCIISYNYNTRRTHVYKERMEKDE